MDYLNMQGFLNSEPGNDLRFTPDECLLIEAGLRALCADEPAALDSRPILRIRRKLAESVLFEEHRARAATAAFNQ